MLHISDTHLLGDSKKLWGYLETENRLQQLLERVRRSEIRPAAMVFTGDLADTGQPEAYRTLKDIVEPLAADIGCQVIWLMGNHDERAPFAEQLWADQSSGEPLDRVYDVEGLRVIALDTSVPGFHHGDLTAQQLHWVTDQLATPAPRGTLLAMHHPPIPTPLEIMGVIELEDQRSFWSAIQGSDVRGILAGHLHYSTFSAFKRHPRIGRRSDVLQHRSGRSRWCPPRRHRRRAELFARLDLPRTGGLFGIGRLRRSQCLRSAQ